MLLWDLEVTSYTPVFGDKIADTTRTEEMGSAPPSAGADGREGGEQAGSIHNGPIQGDGAGDSARQDGDIGNTNQEPIVNGSVSRQDGIDGSIVQHDNGSEEGDADKNVAQVGETGEYGDKGVPVGSIPSTADLFEVTKQEYRSRLPEGSPMSGADFVTALSWSMLVGILRSAWELQKTTPGLEPREMLLLRWQFEQSFEAVFEAPTLELTPRGEIILAVNIEQGSMGISESG